ncbi:MAG: hypothetical protein Q8N81_04165 [bacterium]|nr:hypothetical protein [bacterium]
MLVAIRIQKVKTGASWQKANIVIDAATVTGEAPRLWMALAQGGEEPFPMLDLISSQLRELSPRYIRLDHVFDFYNIISEKEGKFTYDWRRFDFALNEILQTGALPYLSLSYMPLAISSGDLTSPPRDWQAWSELVKALVEHVSGRYNRNLDNVYYEVWNEPDLFGQWTIGKAEDFPANCQNVNSKDYRCLYYYSIIGAGRGVEVNSFLIGGPAITDPRPSKQRDFLPLFLNFVKANNLRLDFLSWHRYHTRPEVFRQDLDFVDSLLPSPAGQSPPGGVWAAPQKIISEWGSVPEKSPIHDQAFDAAHAASVIRLLLDRVDLAFSFEIKDGESEKEFHGGWGLLSHEKFGARPKPKYYALKLLNQMVGNRLKLTGEGTYIDAWAIEDKGTIRAVLVNYDPAGKHEELVPVSFIGLGPGTYEYIEAPLSGTESVFREEVRTLRAESPELLCQGSETPCRKPQIAIYPTLDKAGLSGTGVKGSFFRFVSLPAQGIVFLTLTRREE